MDLAGFKRKTTVKEIGGQSFCFTQLVMGDIVDAYAWAQEQKDKETKKKRDQAVAVAKAIGEISPMDLFKYIDQPMSEKELDNYFETPQGGCYLMYLSLKIKHPDITFQETMTIIDIGLLPELVPFVFGIGKEKKSETVTASDANTAQQ